MSQPTLRAGVDLGGTKIELAVLDGSQILWRARAKTPSGDYAGTLHSIAGLVQDASRQLDAVFSIGVGIPGSVSPDHGRVKNANSVCLIGQDLSGDLAKMLGQDVRLANDADCFALSEASDGAGAGQTLVFGAILGTGCGAGIVHRGQLLSGPNGIAGEWGHNPLPWLGESDGPARPCYCGQFNCTETYLSGPGLSLSHQQRTGQTLTAEAFGMAIQQNDPACVDTLQHYADQLARGLAGVINILDPDVIVVGGGVSNIAPLYALVPEYWGKYVFSDQVNTVILPARHGDSSGVRGAAWLWPVSDVEHRKGKDRA